MNKLYQKSEIWFAVIWIIIYVVGTSFAENISEGIGLSKSITFIFHVVISVIVITWLNKNGLFREYGICNM